MRPAIRRSVRTLHARSAVRDCLRSDRDRHRQTERSTPSSTAPAPILRLQRRSKDLDGWSTTLEESPPVYFESVLSPPEGRESAWTLSSSHFYTTSLTEWGREGHAST